MKNIFLPIAFLLTAVVTNAQNFNWTRHYPTDSTKVGGMVNGKMWYCTIHNRFEAYENGITVPIRALLKQKTVSATSYTPTNADNGYVIHLSAAAGATITMPNTLNDDVLIHFIRDTGAGDMVFQNDGTSVLNGNGGVLSTATDRTITIQGGWVSWMKDGAINWYGTGSLGTLGGGGGGSYTFTASDFNESGSTVSLDYTNAQKASGSQHGFLSSTDWTTFNGKQAALVSGTNIKTINGNSLMGPGDLTISGGGGDALTTNPLSQFAATTSAQLRGVLSDEVGGGAAYFVGGALGTPASGTLTNATGLPISTGVSGLGTGVATLLAGNTNVSPTELNYVDGVTSALQPQVDGKINVYQQTNTYTANRTADLTDIGKYIEMNISVTANTITIPPQSSVAWPADTHLQFVQRGTGPTTIAAGSGVTFLTQSPLLLYPGQVAVAKRISSDLWYIWNGSASSNQFLYSSTTFDFGSISAQSQLTTTLTVVGAADGDEVIIGYSNAAATSGVFFQGRVSATDTVTITAYNITAGALNPASGTFKVTVVKH